MGPSSAGEPRAELSAEEAEEFASRIRPSWAPSLLPQQPGSAAASSKSTEQDIRQGQEETEAWLERTVGQRRIATSGVVALCMAVCGLLMWSLMDDGAPHLASAVKPQLASSPPQESAPQLSLSPATAAPAPRRPANNPVPMNKPPVHSADVAAAAEVNSSLVDLRISTSPEGARVQIDGHEVANPFSGAIARDRNVEVQVSSPGYHTERVTVFTDRGRVIGIVLKPR